MSLDGAGNLAESGVYTFTTLGTPASFTTSALSITPAEVIPGEKVTIGVVITNTSDLRGACEVTLKINDVQEATKRLTIDAGASTTATFTISRDVSGTYAVDIHGLAGSFTVSEGAPVGINWWLIGGIIAGCGSDRRFGLLAAEGEGEGELVTDSPA